MKNNKKILVAVLAIICVVLIATITVIITDKDDTNEVDASGKNNNPVAAIFNKGGITSKDETQGESESESQTESETSTEETENQQTEGSSMNETDSVRPQETPDDTTGAAPSETQPSETPSETQPSETPSETQPSETPSVETQPSETHPQEPDTPEDEPDETQDDTQPDSSEENPAYGTVVIGYSMSDEPRSYNNYMGWKLVVQTYIYSERDSEWTEGGFTPYSVQAWEVNEILKLGRPQAKPDSAGTDGEQRDVYMWVWLD